MWACFIRGTVFANRSRDMIGAMFSIKAVYRSPVLWFCSSTGQNVYEFGWLHTDGWPSDRLNLSATSKAVLIAAGMQKGE